MIILNWFGHGLLYVCEQSLHLVCMQILQVCQLLDISVHDIASTKPSLHVLPSIPTL
jgi:hypothetical protein